MKGASPYISLAAAARLIPGSPDPATLWRWVSRGVATPNGRLRLKHLRVGRNVRTTLAWCMEYLEALTAAASPQTPLDKSAAAHARQEQILHAYRLLDRSPS